MDDKATEVNRKRQSKGLPPETPAERAERERKAEETARKCAEAKRLKREEREGFVTRSWTYRLLPNPEQRTTLRKFHGCARVTYNAGLEVAKGNDGKVPDLETMRARLVYQDAPFVQDGRDWLLQTPKQVRANALRDLIKAQQSNFAKKKRNKKHKWKLRFRKRKNTQAIEIPLQDVRKFERVDTHTGVVRMFPTFLGESGVRFRLREGEAVVEPCGDCRLSMDRRGSFFLHVPHLVPKPETRTSGSVVGIDPGVRSMLAFYSSDGVVGEFGADIAPLERLERLRNKLRGLLRRAKNARRRRGLRKGIARLQTRIENRRSDLHAKAARFFCDNFDIVLLP